MGETIRTKEARGGRQIYVEILVRSSLENLWELSQDPALHPRWDLRFSRITPTGVGSDGHSQFRYEFRLPFYAITGTGTSLGHKTTATGQATSVLRFSTSNPLSPIGPGSGYWRYVPMDQGIRFITGYNYTPGMGAIGRKLDAGFIRPGLGWATAMSFDRLRLWAESGVDPARSRNAWFLDAAARAAGVAGAAALLRHAVAARPSTASFKDLAASKEPTSLKTLSSTASAALGVALAVLSLTLPSHPTVPRAKRCLRQAPDRGLRKRRRH
ncbi:hypothetical protein ACW0JT_05560 [Arthrobacter sp. SA17]